MPAHDRTLRAALPPWTRWAYGIAVFSALAGGVALLARSRHAHPIFVAAVAVALFG